MIRRKGIPQIQAGVFSLGGRIPGMFSRKASSRIAPKAVSEPGDGTTAPALHLTFDDGPTEHHSNEIADLLSEYGVRATFFVTTSGLAEHHRILERLVDGGHEVGTHGHMHVDPWRVSSRRVMSDLEASIESLAEFGVEPKWFRPPHGHVRPCHFGSLDKLSLRLALWDVMPCDFIRGSTPESVFYSTVRRARSGSIVVLHDNESVASTGVTIKATRRILDYYTAQGWRFQTLSGS